VEERDIVRGGGSGPETEDSEGVGEDRARLFVWWDCMIRQHAENENEQRTFYLLW